MSKLSDVKGRIYYISSSVRQENLYAVCETTDRKFWTGLAKCNQEEFIKSGTEGKCIEARELIIALPESFVDYEPKALLKLFTEHFKQNYGTECIAALHHNKRKTNYHIHLIFSERKLLDAPVEKIAARNMFYDEDGKHRRTKKEVLDAGGQIRAGCRVIPKGEVYERNIFTIKDARFKSENFLDEVKRSYTALINIYVKNDKEKLSVFDRNGAYLPMKKIGKNNPKAQQIEADNVQRSKWNETVDRGLVSGVPEEQMVEIKHTQISQKVGQSINRKGKHPELFAAIIRVAIEALNLLINRILKRSFQEIPFVEEQIEEPKKQMQEYPKMSEPASRYARMEAVNQELISQNTAIFEKERSIDRQECKLSEITGFFKGKQRRELQEQIDKSQKQLANMKRRLPEIAAEHGYKNVKEFMAEYQICKSEYGSYRKAVQKWKAEAEGKPEKRSVLDRLEERKKHIRERETHRHYTSVKSKDRGAR